jgi:CAAX prenyl protease-like protein
MAGIFLIPFLAIIGAGMLSRAMTGDFEWIYIVHVLAVCAAFWIYRQQYRAMNWRCTWAGPALGVLVFGVWMGLEWIMTGSPVSAVPTALQSVTPAVRWGWIAFRVVGAVVAVPFAEELAFRGYLMRRLASNKFERLSPAQCGLLSLAISSVLFGAMHGGRWLAGILAGLIYCFAYMRRGRIADAVVAHAVTNCLIAGAVVGAGCWRLW